MKNFKITSKVLMVNVEFPIEVGQLKTTAIAQLHIYENKDGSKGADVEFMDQINTKYMGVEISTYGDWKKFRDFHKSIGLDFEQMLGNKFNEVMTDEVVADLVKDIVF